MLTTFAGTNDMIVRFCCLLSTDNPSMNREETHCDVVKI